MPFNHDNFIATTNYGNLDTLLQWYIDTVGPQVKTLEELAETNPAALQTLYSRDPVLQKLRLIGRRIHAIVATMED